MRYVTSVERLAINDGIRAGVRQGEAMILIRQLEKRFGPLAPDLHERIQAADTSVLELWADRVLDAPTLDGVLAEPTVN